MTTNLSSSTSEFQMLLTELKEISLFTQDVSFTIKNKLSEFSDKIIVEREILISDVDEFDNSITANIKRELTSLHQSNNRLYDSVQYLTSLVG